MFALALVNVDADPSGGPPPTPPPRRPAFRATSTADPTHPTGPDPIDVDQYTHKTATRQRWHWSTSIRSPPRRDHPEPRNHHGRVGRPGGEKTGSNPLAADQRTRSI